MTTNEQSPRRRDRFIQAIAIFKFLKTLLFLLAALGAFGLMQEGIADRAREWGSDLAFTTGQQLVRRVIVLVTGLSRSRIGALGLVALFYSAVFATEGVGLWREKRWAEYLTVVLTGSLIPFEVWEIFNRPSLIKFLTFAVNVAVVIYLIYRLRRPKGAGLAEPAVPNAAPAPEPEQSRVG
ncbi:MAG TPA: DUF2127 domain-containing protein [Gemmatimonadaceae bacterium]|jgi:uncharacterized membrane protein (DUF2068 family)